MDDFVTIFILALVPVVVMLVYAVATRFANVIGNEDDLTDRRPHSLAEAIRRKVAPKPHLSDQNLKVLRQEPVTKEGRAAVLDVIVQQAIAGASWREISKGPMRLYNISQEEVQAEMNRRLGN
jgi:hypothetical protein